MGSRIVLGVVALVLAMAIAAGVDWLQGEHIVASHLAQMDDWNAVRQTEAVVKAGPRPSDWPVRGFVPAALLQSAVENLKDAEIDVPLGKANDGHVDGFVHFVVRSAKLMPDDVRLGVDLATDVSYSADREKPWWSSATANVEVRAALMPMSQKTGGNGVAITQFRIAPDSVSLAAGVANFDLRIIVGMARALAAEETTIRLRDALVLDVPGLAPSVDLDPSVNSKSFQPFGGVATKNAGTNITVSMKGTPRTLGTVLDQWLLTKSGLWALGGKSVVAPSTEDAPPPEEIEARRSGLVAKLEPFQRADSFVEVTVPSKTLTDFVDTVLSPSPLNLNVSTSGTNGNITDAIAIHNDKVLGNVGLEVKPRGDGFGHGVVALTPGPAQWAANAGISVPLSVKAKAAVSLDVHLDTGIGGGIGVPVDLDGDGTVQNLTIRGSFERRSAGNGTAIVLQPTLPCAPMSLTVHPGPNPLVALPWIKLDPVGLNLDREIGGMKIAPAVLLDTLPVITKLPSKDEATPGAKPTSAAIKFPRPYLVTTLSPDSIVMGQTEIVLRAGAQLALRADAETDVEKNARKDLRNAMKDAAPEVNCKAITGLQIVGGGTTIIDLYRELAYIGESSEKSHRGG